ncbi:DUF6632 domain-containing protein [Dyella flava]|uniref:SPW repeat-containing protein n=1 Tax=Dyella flava TaxID=1920170 RepID=A0ABS2K0U0_9GAMM|nr:DUF6632 domain-containing protein [Dyella flava]MBM7124848.1 hypothetical protein [Dyella flava]GLQ50891.1 hypothetical protein GCM10010872_23400 [Dyella flava]
MNMAQHISFLKIVLRIVGILFFCVYPLMLVWPSGWTWHSGYSDYPMMIVGIYATLGVFLLRAANDPLHHLSLIWFTVWSSIVHGLIMAVQSFATPGHMGHLVGDIPALFIIAIALAWLTPRHQQRDRLSTAS